tara:strand:+ start:254 stop:916 length:663 start_codon:yes stop_codon:yes gene_type:complete
MHHHPVVRVPGSHAPYSGERVVPASVQQKLTDAARDVGYRTAKVTHVVDSVRQHVRPGAPLSYVVVVSAFEAQLSAIQDALCDAGIERQVMRVHGPNQHDANVRARPWRVMLMSQRIVSKDTRLRWVIGAGRINDDPVVHVLSLSHSVPVASLQAMVMGCDLHSTVSYVCAHAEQQHLEAMAHEHLAAAAHGLTSGNDTNVFMHWDLPQAPPQIAVVPAT